MATRGVDVVVVGAGISGLTAARYLLNKDPSLRVLVLEGKDRVGGRTLSVPLKTESGTEVFDLGGQWVGRCQSHVMSLIAELGLETHEQYTTGTKVIQLGNKIRKYQSTIPRLSPLALIDVHRMFTKTDRLSKLIDPHDPYSCPEAEKLDSMTFQTWVESFMWHKESLGTTEAAFRCVLGAEISQVSALYVLTYIATAGSLMNLVEATPHTAQEYRIKGGAQQISQVMADQLGGSRVMLEEGVIHISQTEEDVTVRTVKGQAYHCRKVILAIPPPLRDKIEFDPSLPGFTKEFIKRMPVGTIIKVIITFKTAFWRAAGLSGEAVTTGGSSISSQCKTGPLCIVYDGMSANGIPALVAFLGGAQAVAWRQETVESRRSAVLRSLAEFYGDDVYQYIDYAEKDWAAERYNEGGPVCCVGTGAMEYYAKGLRQPFGRVHFAGTESATSWCGFMSGAVQAGRRAAVEVLYDLRPQVVNSEDLAEISRKKRLVIPKIGLVKKVVKVTCCVGVVVVLVFTAKRLYHKVSS